MAESIANPILWNALNESGVSNFGGSFQGEASPLQRAAAGANAGLGGLGGRDVGFETQDAQLTGIEQQNKFRKQLMEMLLGGKGGGGILQGMFSGGGVGGLITQLENAGQGTRNVINENFSNLQNSTMANFAKRGLGGSSGVPSVMSGIERQKALAIGELDDNLINQKVGVQERGMDRAMQLQQSLMSML